MSIREQAREIVRKMTIKEKVAQLYAVWAISDDNGNISLRSLSSLAAQVDSHDPFEVIRDGIGQITRPLGSQNTPPIVGVRTLNKLQKFLVTKTRLGIPALPHEECLSGLMAKGATIFPSGINNGSTWDPDLIERTAGAIGKEVYSAGSRQGLAPVLDVCRDARWGRTEETFGEDPYLTGVLGTAYVKGLQNKDHPLIATLKHYVGHSFSEGGRNHAPVRVGWRELNDVFLFPFEMAVKYGEVGSIMPAYHDIDGEPLHQSEGLLNKLLRERWGFDGIVVSDYEGLMQLVSDHRTQPDIAHAAAASLKAGVDVELPGNTLFGEGIEKALDKNLLDIAVVDEAVARHLSKKMELGLFAHPYVEEELVLASVKEHSKLALEAAERSLVLLKNDGALPLKNPGKIALVGPLADEPMGMMGGYAFPVHLILSELKDGVSQLETLREALEDAYGEQLLYSKGCEILTGRPEKPPVFPGDVSRDGSVQYDYLSKETGGIAEALKVAKEAETIILAVGDLAGLFLSGTVGEGSDASSLILPGVQQQLIDEIIALKKTTIIVSFSGRPYHLQSGHSGANAILQAWLPGQEGAKAVLNVLTGKTNPGGKLPISIPKDAGAMPFYYNHKLKSAGTPIQPDFGAEFPFGHGCSYTHFTVMSCTLEPQEYDTTGTIRIEVVIKNTGDYPGDEVIQVYVRDLLARVVRPVQELKAFKRVSIDVGESARIQFSIPVDLLSYTLEDGKRIVEPGEFDIQIGTSSQDIFKQYRLTLTGETRILDEHWRMISETSCTKSLAPE